MNDKQAGSKFQGVSPCSRDIGEDRNEQKGDFSAACAIKKKIVREEDAIMKNENESEDGVVEHSKVQELESRKKICQKF